MITKTLDELHAEIVQWADERNLLEYDNRKSQALKVAEEAGELCGGVVKGNRDDVYDAIGDVFVTIVILCEQYDYNFNGIVENVTDTIKKRTGKTIGGAFIKD
jgi:NTP pyrophosphatase (non-canonical NTP hydrolase)